MMTLVLVSLTVFAATEKKLDLSPKPQLPSMSAETQGNVKTLELPKAPPAMKDASKISFDDTCAGSDTAATSRKNLPADSTCAVNAVRNTSQDSRSMPGRDRGNTSTSGTVTVNTEK